MIYRQIQATESLAQALLLALRLWSRCSPEMVNQCPLLPSNVKPMPQNFFTEDRPEASSHPAAAAEAFFSAGHLQKILTPLRLSTASHPRLHSLWPSLFALLIPGFTPFKVDLESRAVFFAIS